MARKNGFNPSNSDTSVDIFIKKEDSQNKNVYDFLNKMGTSYADRISVMEDVPEHIHERLVPHAVLKNTRMFANGSKSMNRAFSETALILENWLSNTQNISRSQMLSFFSELEESGESSACSLHVPCIVFYGSSLQFRCEEIFDIQRLLGYPLYMCNKDENSDDSKHSIESDLTNKGEFRLAIIDSLTELSEDIHISFGSVEEIHEYVRNRMLKPEVELRADNFTKPVHVSGLQEVNVLWSKEHNKTVLLLGERHDQIGVCDNKSKEYSMNAENFFFDLLKRNARSVIDVFGEFDISFQGKIESRRENTMARYSVDQASDSFMVRTSQSLANQHCLYENDVNYRSCPYKDHVRFHLTDFRRTQIPFLQYLSTLYWIRERALDAKETRQHIPATNIDVYIRTLKLEKNKRFDNKATLLEQVRSMFNILKINKQIENIRPDKLKRGFQQSVEVYCNTLENSLAGNFTTVTKNFLSQMKNARDDEEYFNICENLVGHLRIAGLVSAKLMDFYLLSRMLRYFEPKLGRLSDDIKNVIVYAGRGHTHAYRASLKSFGFVETYSKVGRPGREEACLYVADLTWPYLPSRPS